MKYDLNPQKYTLRKSLNSFYLFRLFFKSILINLKGMIDLSDYSIFCLSSIILKL
jgi:hypothetical protein